MLVNVVKELYHRNPDSFEALAQKSMWIYNAPGDNSKKYEKISDDCYLWRYANNRNKLNGLRYIFDELNIAYGELQLLIQPLSITENDNVDLYIDEDFEV